MVEIDTGDRSGSSDRNIVLIGFASSGKTATGLALAQTLGFDHRDLDREVERLDHARTGRQQSVREIFRRVGAEEFSRLEGEIIGSLQSMRRTVLSTGGRAPLPPDNRSGLSRLGLVVYLRAEPHVIRQRMESKGVPVSISGDMADEYRRRDPVYREVADLIIDNSDLSPEETALRIRDKLTQWDHPQQPPPDQEI